MQKYEKTKGQEIAKKITKIFEQKGSENMGKLCATFKLFSGMHFVYLLVAIALSLLTIFLLKNIKHDNQKFVKIILFAVGGVALLIDFIGKIMVLKPYKFFENMPAQLFHIFYYICIFVFITKKANWTKFAYFIILPLSIYSLIFIPTVYHSFAPFSLTIIAFVIANVFLISFSILNLIWSEKYLDKKDILNSTMNFTVIVAIMHIINVFLRFATWGVNANYLGTMGEDYDIIVGLLFRVIPISFVVLFPLIALLVGVQFLMILPFEVLKTKKEKQDQLNEIIALGNLKAQQKFRDQNKKNKSQILIRNDQKASAPRTGSMTKDKDGFVSTTKEVKTNKEEK